MKPNQDIRDYMADRGVGQRRLSEQLGVAVSTVCNMLKTELSQKEKEDLIRHIDACEKEHLSSCVDEEPAEEATEAEVDSPEEDVTNNPKFSIGDRVKIPSKNLTIGIVSDIWHSIVQARLMYAVEVEPDGHCALFAEDQLEPAPLPIEYSWQACIDGNVAVVTMTATQGEKSWIYARGHAHILHDGEVGMAQAISYAARRMFETLDTKQDKQIYFKNGGTGK